MHGSSLGRPSGSARVSLSGGTSPSACKATTLPAGALASPAIRPAGLQSAATTSLATASPKAVSPHGGGKGPAGKGCGPVKGSPGKGSARGAPPGKAPMRGLPPKALSAASAGKGGGSPFLGSRTARGHEETGPKLRPLFWTVTRQLESESVWAKIGEAPPFDRALLEKQFVLTAPRTAVNGVPGTLMARSASRDTGIGDGATGERKQRVRVLDDRTSRLLEIAFRKLPAPIQLAKMVDRLDNFPEGLPNEAVLALHGALQEQQEAIDQIRQLSVAAGDILQLDVPERYLWVLGQVPSCSAKVACGALIVNTAGELQDLRRSGEKVSSCCQALRSSELLRRCLSTTLAVGNLLNRGTSRAGAQGVVLPEALLKLDELRGVNESEDATPNGEGPRGPSVLDFITQALVDAASRNPSGTPSGSPNATTAAICLERLREEAEWLLKKARGAQSVPLEEAENNCRKLSTEARGAQQSLAEVREKSAGCIRMAEKVRKTCDEAKRASDEILTAKEEVTRTLVWSSVRDSKVKSSDWFAQWGQFLDQLLKSLTRARAHLPLSSAGNLSSRPPPRSPPVGTPRTIQPTRYSSAPELTCATPLGRKTELPAQGTAIQPSMSPGSIARRLEAVKREDDALSDVSDWESRPASAAAPPGAPAADDQAKQKLGADQKGGAQLHSAATSVPPQQRSGSDHLLGQCASLSPCPTPPTPQKQLLFTPPQTPVQPPPARPAGSRLPLQPLQQPQPVGDPPKHKPNVDARTMRSRLRRCSGGG